MDFYEIGVYLIIIIVAAASVFGVMWLLMRSMQPAGRVSKPGVALLKSGPEKSSVKIKEEQQAEGKYKDKDKRKGKGKSKVKVKEERLLKLKELPEDRLLPEVNRAEEDTARKHKEKSPEGKDEKNALPVGDTAPGDEQQELAEIALPDLPSMDTLTESEEEQPEHNIQDLMSVFEVEDAEDSATSDLAANLFDVDVENIEKLGSEVSEFLGGMRSR